jgi:hypothetical protein
VHRVKDRALILALRPRDARISVDRDDLVADRSAAA